MTATFTTTYLIFLQCGTSDGDSPEKAKTTVALMTTTHLIFMKRGAGDDNSPERGYELKEARADDNAV